MAIPRLYTGHVKSLLSLLATYLVFIRTDTVLVEDQNPVSCLTITPGPQNNNTKTRHL